MNRERLVSVEDLKILEMTTDLLSNEEKWNREDDRLCFYKEKWSLFCALAKASIEITGKYKHRRVAIQEIRFTINDNFPERWRAHQLMEFNNHPATTFRDIRQVLEDTKKHLESRYQDNKDNELSKSNNR